MALSLSLPSFVLDHYLHFRDYNSLFLLCFYLKNIIFIKALNYEKSGTILKMYWTNPSIDITQKILILELLNHYIKIIFWMITKLLWRVCWWTVYYLICCLVFWRNHDPARNGDNMILTGRDLELKLLLELVV